MRAAALLILALSSTAAAAGTGSFVPYRSPDGRFECEIPAGAEPNVLNQGGVVATRLDLDLMAIVDINVYPIPLRKRLAGGGAQGYLEELKSEAGAVSTSMVSPLKAGTFHGYKAWMVTRDYRIETRPAGSGKVDTRDTHLVIERDGSFLDVAYQSRPSYFEDKRAVYDHIVSSLTLQPEPFLATRKGLFSFLAFALALLAGGGYALYRRGRGAAPLAVALLAIAFSAGPARAQRAVPATDAPQSGVWGPDHEERLRKIFSRLLAASGYDGGRQKDMRGPTELLYRKDLRDAGGSPAAAVSARIEPNRTDHSIVFAGFGIFELCRNEDELAFILAHELSHLVLKHSEERQAKALALLEAWTKKNDLKKFADDAAAVKAFDQANVMTVEAYVRAQEREADKEGLALARLVGFDPKGAAKAMEHAQDWVWATTDGTPDTTHDPIAKRVGELRRIALQMEAQEKKFAKADGASGGLKTGADAMSAGDAAGAARKQFDANGLASGKTIASNSVIAPLVGPGAGGGQLRSQGYTFEAYTPPPPPPAKLAERIKKDKKLEGFYGGLADEEKAEFNTLYEKYSANVDKRKGEGWSNGWWGNVGVNRSREDNEKNVSKFAIDHEVEKMEKDNIPGIEARLKTAPEKDRAGMEKDLALQKNRLVELKATQQKKWGLCVDWALDNESALQGEHPKYMEVKKLTRSPMPHDWAIVGGLGEHSGLEVKSRRDPTKSVVLDPWSDGEPDLKTREEWVGSRYEY